MGSTLVQVRPSAGGGRPDDQPDGHSAAGGPYSAPARGRAFIETLLEKAPDLAVVTTLADRLAYLLRQQSS